MSKNHSLSHSVLNTWKNYEKQVCLSRRQISTKNIHQLRISTQKLEAVLTLANSLKSNHNSKNIIYLIKKVRKCLGPLRDIQVESAALKGLKENEIKHSGQSKFSKFFSNQKTSARKKAIKCLDKISLKHEQLRIKRLAKKLAGIENQKSEKRIQVELDRKVKSLILLGSICVII